MSWHEIHSKKDIDKLMEFYGEFHDSCIKEIRYVSGAFVDEDRSMYPVDSERILSVVFQSQEKGVGALELMFIGLNKLSLVPRKENYDCIILEASLVQYDGLFYWSEWSDFTIADINEVEGTWISAKKIAWRQIPNGLGEDEIFTMNK